MLLELSIVDFAIIEETTIRFTEGLNAVTGETGAGKSILLDALGAVLGARVSADLVREGARAARIEAAFDTSGLGDEISEVLAAAGVPHEGSDLILTREILASGRSSARINGRMTTASDLARVGGLLVDIHGQSDHLAILRSGEQRDLLDRFGHLVDERARLSILVHQWRDIRRRSDELAANARAHAQQVDLLRFQVEEIDSAALDPDEDLRLAADRDVLRNADRLREDSQAALILLSGDDLGEVQSAASLLRELAAHIDDLARTDPRNAELAERAQEVLVLTEDLARDIRDYADGIDSDDERLAAVEDRLDLIQTLKRKYGATIEEIVAHGKQARTQLESLTSADYDANELATRERDLRQELVSAAVSLSSKRERAGKRLSNDIEQSVRDLNLGNAKVAIEVAHRTEPAGIPLPDGQFVHIDETGIDQVQFMIALNAGESLKPLARVASGGETARLMLATKAVLSQVDHTPTLVFDEIDVGIGGRSGQVVGEKLWSISRSHQVIVISHLAQVPSFADSHVKIEKVTRGGRTLSIVRELGERDRIEELAAMIDGKPPTDESRSNARVMLERSRTWISQQLTPES